ncbi:MAG: T9SS type A sorting domain-containing protein, partial [Bacteroidota bacterium]
ANDLCQGAISITSATSCSPTAGTLVGSTFTAGLPACGGYNNVDAWYSFVAQSPIPTITVTGSSGRIQGELYSGTCGSFTCITNSSGNSSPKTLNPTGLTIGQTYYIRITTNNASTPTFTVCVVDPTVAAAPSNDNCSGATSLTPGSSCVNTGGTLAGATVSSPSVTSACGTPGADVWYSFTAASNFPTITLSSVGASIGTSYIQLLSGTCGSQTSIACASGTSLTPGGTGLSIGTTYYVRIYTANTYTGGSGWTFNICITNGGTSSTAVVDYSKSYINVTKLSTGGSVEPGDVLEIRGTFVVRSGTVDSVAFYDTLQSNSGFTLLSSSIVTRTNEGKIYRNDSPSKVEFTDALDTDAGWYSVSGADTIIQINMGTGASGTKRGTLTSTSRPSVYGSTCIVMATYRVQVNAGYNSTINWGGGAITYKDNATGNMKLLSLKNDYLTVYVSPGLCSSALSTLNKIGIETNGTFDAPSVPNSGNRNRGTSTAVPSYTYATFSTAGSPTPGGGPNDYYYGVTNNTSATYTTTNTYTKSTSNSSIPQRVFSHWDITGDHTNATNTAKGNPPCNYALPVSATNPCGYMLVVNAAYKTDTAFKSTITNLCPNTYYEISAWIKNICYKCGCDSNGVGAASGSSSYIPLSANDSSGVQPNLNFQINGQDYYSTGNITYAGTGAGITQMGSDSTNVWVKRGFVYKTGAAETGFEFLIRNNAPGGGGNDWAIDDIGISTCLPTMTYSPSTSPNVCMGNTLTINDTIRSSYENYTSYKWQRSTNGGSSWSDIPSGSGTGSAVWSGTAWEYVANYVVPTGNTTLADSADLYRMVVATTSANLSDANCLFTEALNIITLNVIDCGVLLNTDLISFNGKIINDHSQLSWSTSKENDIISFDIEKSTDGINFRKIGSVNGYNDNRSEINHYTFIDPENFGSKSWYKILLKNKKGGKKYSSIIQLSREQINFGLGNIVNPFKNELDFEVITTNNAKIDVSLIDLFGKTVRYKNLTVYSGVNSLAIDNTQGLNSGIYILQVKHNDIVINKKVLKR